MPPKRGGSAKQTSKGKGREKAVEEERATKWGYGGDESDTQLPPAEIDGGWGGMQPVEDWDIGGDSAVEPSSPPPLSVPLGSVPASNSKFASRTFKHQPQASAPLSFSFLPSGPDSYPGIGGGYGAPGPERSPVIPPKSPPIHFANPGNGRHFNTSAVPSSGKPGRYDVSGNLPNAYPSGIANLPNVPFSTLSPLGDQRSVEEPPPTVSLGGWQGMEDPGPEHHAQKRGGPGIKWGETTKISPRGNEKPPVVTLGGWPGDSEEPAPGPASKRGLGPLGNRQKTKKKPRENIEQEEINTQQHATGWGDNAGDTWGGGGLGTKDATDWNNNPTNNAWTAPTANSWGAPANKSTLDEPDRSGAGTTAWGDLGQPQPDSPPEDPRRGKGKGKKKGKNSNTAGPFLSTGAPMNVNLERGREDQWDGASDGDVVHEPLSQSWAEPGLKGLAGGSTWNNPTPAHETTLKPLSRDFGSAILLDSGTDRKSGSNLVSVQESGGKGLADAHRAMYGSHRLALDRFMWILPYQHDPRVVWMHEFIERSGWALANFGFYKYRTTRQKGGLFVNVNYFSEKNPSEPAFDWLTFADLQETRDRTLQHSVAANNPAKTCLVFMFLVSKSGSSMGIWRRKLPIPQSLQTAYLNQVRSVESELRDNVYVVKVDPNLSKEARARLNAGVPTAIAPGVTEADVTTGTQVKKRPGRLARLVRWITWQSDTPRDKKKQKS